MGVVYTLYAFAIQEMRSVHFIHYTYVRAHTPCQESKGFYPPVIPKNVSDILSYQSYPHG